MYIKISLSSPSSSEQNVSMISSTFSQPLTYANADYWIFFFSLSWNNFKFVNILEDVSIGDLLAAAIDQFESRLMGRNGKTPAKRAIFIWLTLETFKLCVIHFILCVRYSIKRCISEKKLSWNIEVVNRMMIKLDATPPVIWRRKK